MRPSTRAVALASLLLVAGASRLLAEEPVPEETAPIQQTDRSSTLRQVYFPFLALGHGIFAIVEYGIGYPIYYLTKPAIDFAYSSSDDPADFPNSVGKQQQH